MANTLGVYNPVFYAQEALIQLEKALGMASRVYMGFDQERKGFGLGETINIRRPSTFSVDNAPATAADVTTQTTSMTLDNWREVKFKLSDKELAFTGERIINDHIRPAAYALADDIDTKLAALWWTVPYFANHTGSALVASDLTLARAALFDQKVPLQDAGNIHMMVDGNAEMELLNLSAFSQQQGAGDMGVNTQLRGSLGMKYGMEIFANQNTYQLATADIQGSTPQADFGGESDGAIAKNASSFLVDNITNGEIVKKGTAVAFAGDDYKYAVAADVEVSAGEATITIDGMVHEAIGDGVVATFTPQVAGASCTAFHRNAFGLAMAPLSEMGNELGANIATIQDPVTGLAIRSRVYYVGNSSEVHVALDVLFGVKTLDERLAYRMIA